MDESGSNVDESRFLLEDSDYDEGSIEESTEINNESKLARSATIIDDSDEEGTSSGLNSHIPSIASSLSGSVVEDRLTPSINKAIRRSLHHFTKSSSEEDEDYGDGESEAEVVEAGDDSSTVGFNAVRAHLKKHNVITDTTSEEDESRPINGRHSVRDSDSSPDRPSKVDQHSGSKSRNRKRIVIDDDSSDEDGQIKEQSRRSVRGSVSSPEKHIQRRPQNTKYGPSSTDESDADHYHEDGNNDTNDSQNIIEDADSSGFENRSKSEIHTTSGSGNEIEIINVPKKQTSLVELSSSGDERETSVGDDPETTMAISMAKEETVNTTIDPVMAQQRALLVYKQQKIQNQLAKAKMIFNTGNMALLPDRGERLRVSIAEHERELAVVAEELRNAQLGDFSTSPRIKTEKRAPLFKEESLEVDPTYLKPTTEDIKRELGRKALATMEREQALTVERLQDLHGSLLARPAEDERAKDPRGLKVPLMPHQQHALAWLLWREQQKPPGGVLADDMGLGKTLTMISLVMASIAKREAGEDSDNENEWQSSARAQKHLGGTLVVAPASLLAQWEAEVNNRCKRGIISVELYHGNNRESVPRRLAKTDIVVTTYNILSREMKNNGVLYKIRWRRVVLDEAHVIRNHKSQTCEAVCALHANKRWALTGTPIHNKEMDLYSILKFLQCSPFDDVRVWKRWVDNKNAAGHERLATVMKTLMLRRTKAELQAKGELETMPDKSIEVINVDLDTEERLVYDKVMVYSRTLFAQFLAQRAEKNHMFELGAGKYDKPSWTVTHKNTQFTQAQNKLLSLHADVKSHEILVLLLRLRQVCCHPSLIHSMLDQEDIEQDGLEDGGTDVDLLSKMGTMNLKDENGEEDVGVDERVAEHLLTSDNPVFDPKRRSSKMRAILAKTREILDKGDKLIIVSQWVGVLNVVADALDSIDGASYRMFTGQVAVKDRQGVMDDFNSRRGKSNILLLSLTAGGVGLNLVGANHLLLIDIHWNPQLESQAQDRIYRFGQVKDVHIYKYICTDTIEERIKALQEKKLEIASSVLSGGGKVVGSKLSLDDLKSLFSL